MWFDTGAKAWSTAGCAVRNVTSTAVICECSHLTDFAVRFAAIDEAGVDLFASNGPLLEVRRLPLGAPLLIAMGVVVGAGLLVAALGRRADSAGDARFVAALAADEDLAFARVVDRLKGAALPLDRLGAGDRDRKRAGGEEDDTDEEEGDEAAEASSARKRARARKGRSKGAERGAKAARGARVAPAPARPASAASDESVDARSPRPALLAVGTGAAGALEDV
jgi:hypothetical protein